jgi:glucose/arabinose dehydrogenase
MLLRSIASGWIFSILAVACAARADTAKVPIAAGSGPAPVLPAPVKSWLPTVHIAPARGWPAGATPMSAPGTAVNAFASDLDHPRWLYVLPNGDVLVAETDAPHKPDDGKGIEGWIHKLAMRHAGSGRKPSANRVTLLRDTRGTGAADSRTAFIEGLNSPFGMALVGDNLYVADTDAVLRFPYRTGDTRITAAPTKLTDLPAGTINHHWTKSLIASPDGSKLYVGVGSNSNAGENGLPVENQRAAVWEIDVNNGAHRVFASGLRNPVGLAWEPQSGALWVAVNERDELGSDLVPDYMTALHDGAFYGWPFSYFGAHLDTRVKPQNPELVARATVPDYALGAHTASLGLCSAQGSALPPPLRDGMFIGQHGSWNRRPFSGYKVVFVPFFNGMPEAQPIDVLTGFLDEDGNAQGRPVGVAIDAHGALLVADDVGNKVWRVINAAATANASAAARADEPDADGR